jgi:hypothetical protein
MGRIRCIMRSLTALLPAAEVNGEQALILHTVPCDWVGLCPQLRHAISEHPCTTAALPTAGSSSLNMLDHVTNGWLVVKLGCILAAHATTWNFFVLLLARLHIIVASQYYTGCWYI